MTWSSADSPGQSSLDTHNRWASWGRWERFQKPEALAASFLGSGRAEALGERFAATKEDRAFQRKLAQRAGKALSAAFDKRHRKPAATSSLRRQTEASTAREAAGRAAAQAQSGFYASDEAAIVRDYLDAMIDRYGARDRNAPGLDMLEYARGLVDTAHGELHASAAAKVHWAAAEAHENVYARLAASSTDLAPGRERAWLREAQHAEKRGGPAARDVVDATWATMVSAYEAEQAKGRTARQDIEARLRPDERRRAATAYMTTAHQVVTGVAAGDRDQSLTALLSTERAAARRTLEALPAALPDEASVALGTALDAAAGSAGSAGSAGAREASAVSKPATAAAVPSAHPGRTAAAGQGLRTAEDVRALVAGSSEERGGPRSGPATGSARAPDPGAKPAAETIRQSAKEL
ncbi:hypothetical protein ACPA54_02250 [Uniformispora flossi]|uniref:hypothetical protein n=1 Tax=Uniformispora flossi TaxID=3390723 RepID=UPI003C2E5A7D